MKKFINFALNNKLAIWILTIIVLAAGLYSGLNMKQETIPNIELPNLSIMTVYPGAAPNVVDEDVTSPIESRLKGIENVEIIQSSSYENASSVMMQFDYGTDMDKAAMNVKEELDKIDLPDVTQDPTVSRISFNAIPILAVSISDEERSSEELTNAVENQILPDLQGIDGVSDIQITGQQAKEVNLKFDEDALSKYNLDEETVTQLIKGSQLTYPLGLTNFNKSIKNVVIDGDITTLEDLKNLQIPYTPQMGNSPGMSQEDAQMSNEGLPLNGDMDNLPNSGMNNAALGDVDAKAQDQIPQEITLPTVALKDIADLSVEKTVDSISKTNGKESIGLQFIKSADANTAEVVDNVNDKITQIEDDYNVEAITTMDQGEPIEESVNTMLEKALYGIIFAVIVILLFLRNIRTTLISIVSIPLSLLIAMFLLHQMDISLNILTLGALTVAIGRVIDDSIVVMENIFRRMSDPLEHLQGKELVQEATRQMFKPIASSTIVTVVVFLPIAFTSGMVGELFMPFAYAVVFALGASLLVAVTVVPILAHTLFRKRLENPQHNKQYSKKQGKLAKTYKRILNGVLNHKIVTFISAVVLLALSFFIIPIIGTDFLADQQEKMIIATYSPDPGETFDEAKNIVFDANDFVGERPGVTTYQFSIGGGNPMAAMMGGGNDSSALFFIEYDDDYENFSDEQTKLIDRLNEMSDKGEWSAMDFASMGSGFELYVYSDNLNDIEEAVNDIMPKLEENNDLENVESSISEAYDQYTLKVNQEKASENGLTAAQIGMALNDSEDTNAFTTVKYEDKDIDVFLDVEEETYDNITDMTDKEIMTPLGKSVKIADVVDVVEGQAPDTITRRDGKIYASISADITSRDTGGVSNDVKNDIEAMTLPNGVTTDFGGVTEQMNEAFTQLGLAMLAAIAIIYFVLVVTFGGGLAPFAILFSLPFTIIGSLVALWIAGEPLSVSSLIGALMLIGIVVTNAIVLIDRVIHNENDGYSTREALLEAGGTRLRPILMTALATIGALIPLLIGIEGGGMISKGLAITVVGGLLSSTLLTLIIVPIVYETFSKFRRKNKKA